MNRKAEKFYYMERNRDYKGFIELFCKVVKFHCVKGILFYFTFLLACVFFLFLIVIWKLLNAAFHENFTCFGLLNFVILVLKNP